MQSNNSYRCCLCHAYFTGYGNDPFPVKSKGRCCDLCNFTKVIPARINAIKGQEVTKDGNE